MRFSSIGVEEFGVLHFVLGYQNIFLIGVGLGGEIVIGIFIFGV